MIARKHRPTRSVSQLVRLTADERARADRLVALYGGTLSDVLRAGIGALEREHAETDDAGELGPSTAARGVAGMAMVMAKARGL